MIMQLYLLLAHTLAHALFLLSVKDVVKIEASEKGERTESTENTFNGELVSALIALFVSTRAVIESKR